MKTNYFATATATGHRNF